MRTRSFETAQRARRLPEDANVCGVLVMCRPEHLEGVHDALAEVAGVEIHLADSDGRFVVTVEDTEEAWASDIIEHLGTLPGVLSAPLVYHHSEPAEAMQQETRT